MSLNFGQVLESGYCIGCGTCAGLLEKIEMRWTSYGDKEARIISSLNDAEEKLATYVCPFSSRHNESDIAKSVFIDAPLINSIIGHYIGSYIGYSDEFRGHGSSGGIVTHLLSRLLYNSHVDGVFCVGPTERKLAEFKLVDNQEELKSCATSFYYPVSLENVLTHIKSVPGRYAITGVPCFHKSIRLARELDPVLNERIVIQVGIVCGQMKSADYAEYLARRCGKRSSSPVERACFRNKDKTTTADNYRFNAKWTANDGAVESGSILAKEIGINWAMSYFKPKACDYCDDIFAECADVAVMDAWLPGVVNDPRGTSLIISRSKFTEELLVGEMTTGRLNLAHASLNDLIDSQEAGLRHRREGLRFRLALAVKIGFQVPIKRVVPSFKSGISLGSEMIMRSILRRCSRGFFLIQRRSGVGLSLFKALMLLPLFFYKVFGKLRRRFARSEPNQRDLTAFFVD